MRPRRAPGPDVGCWLDLLGSSESPWPLWEQGQLRPVLRRSPAPLPACLAAISLTNSRLPARLAEKNHKAHFRDQIAHNLHASPHFETQDG